MRASHIVVIADDLSGAAELAGIAFAHGLSAEVQTRFEPASKAQVVAVDTDSRGLPAEAAERVREVAEQVVATQPTLIFKKVDSVLRGQPRAEIEAILAATGQRRAVLVPANPSRGRVIESGRYLINGVPLDQTEFANDPDYPRLSSEVAALLGGTTENIVISDVATAGDLKRIARSLEQTTLAAGAADFFAAILTHRGCAPSTSTFTDLPFATPALLVCGSMAAWSTRYAECIAASLPIVSPDQASGRWLDVATQALRSSGVLALSVGDLAAPPERRSETFARFTAAAAELVRRAQPATVLTEGGATAAALARHLGWSRLGICAAAPAGVGVLQPLGADICPLVLIKPGSYSWPPAIWLRLCKCLHAS
jgi:D-threonate/D-erythronate kinase